MDRRAISFVRELAREEASRVVIRGDCMEPLLQSGAAVYVRAKRTYLPGDVIVFGTAAGDLMAHRVLGWRPAGLVTKGDHCTIHDAAVPSSAIVGAADVPVGWWDRVRAVGRFALILIRRVLR